MSSSLHDGPVYVPSTSTPPAMPPARPEILSRAQIAARRMAADAALKAATEPKGKPRK